MKSRIMRAASRPTAKAEPANFVGMVLSDPVYAPEQPSRLRASRVSFMPGGRTNWHKHAVGQILYVLSGVGRYQLEGEPVQGIDQPPIHHGRVARLFLELMQRPGQLGDLGHRRGLSPPQPRQERRTLFARLERMP